MATYQVSLRAGRGSFFRVGTELTYDSTPARSDIEVGGVVDFTSRSSAESDMLKGNSSAGSADLSVRTQAIIYGLAIG